MSPLAQDINKSVSFMSTVAIHTGRVIARYLRIERKKWTTPILRRNVH